MEQAHHSILQAIVRHLEQGARDRRSPLHTPVVGTADGDLRIMVLRDFSAGEWTMRFHTDARSPKVRTLGEGGRVTVLGYDPSAKLQLRLYGSGRTEHTGPLVDAAWQASSEYARRCYLAEASPGSPMPAAGSGLPAWAEEFAQTKRNWSRRATISPSCWSISKRSTGSISRTTGTAGPASPWELMGRPLPSGLRRSVLIRLLLVRLRATRRNAKRYPRGL